MNGIDDLLKGSFLTFVLFGSRDLVRIMPLLFGWKMNKYILDGVTEDTPRIMKAWATLTAFWTFSALVYSVDGYDPIFILHFVKLGIIGAVLCLLANFAGSKKPNLYVPEEEEL